jgi:hypothetical protein
MEENNEKKISHNTWFQGRDLKRHCRRRNKSVAHLIVKSRKNKHNLDRREIFTPDTYTSMELRLILAGIWRMWFV